MYVWTEPSTRRISDHGRVRLWENSPILEPGPGPINAVTDYNAPYPTQVGGITIFLKLARQTAYCFLKYLL